MCGTLQYSTLLFCGVHSWAIELARVAKCDTSRDRSTAIQCSREVDTSLCVMISVLYCTPIRTVDRRNAVMTHYTVKIYRKVSRGPTRSHVIMRHDDIDDDRRSAGNNIRKSGYWWMHPATCLLTRGTCPRRADDTRGKNRWRYHSIAVKGSTKYHRRDRFRHSKKRRFTMNT